MRKLFLITSGLLLLVTVCVTPRSSLKSCVSNLTPDHYSDKPGALDVHLVPRAEVTSLNQILSADLHVRARASTGLLHVAVSPTGSAVAVGPTAFDLAATPSVEVATPIQYSVIGSGPGELRVKVTSAGESQSSLIYVLAANGEALHGSSGPLDLRLKRLDRDHTSGKVDDPSYAALLDSISGGGAGERSESKESTTSGSVSGLARWTDRSGAAHPIRQARVELRDSSNRQLIAETTTGGDGAYLMPTSRPGSFYVRVLSQGPGFVVRSSRGAVQHIDSFVHAMRPATQLSLDLTANNFDDNNTAFSVADAILTADLYIEQLRVSSLPTIDIIFPSPLGTFFDKSVPNINVLRLDRFDWDVSMHEFGHYVAANLGLTRSAGGFHFIGFNMSELLGKQTGIPLAWSEGWATYFGTSVQQVMRTTALGIPFVGDTHYTDTEDAEIDYDLETQTGGVPPFFIVVSNGEDDEASVQRILWDVFDTANDDGDDGVALGDSEIISALQSTQAASLSEAFAALASGRPVSEVAKLGCIFTEHRVAPLPTEPADGAVVGTVAPTFEWIPNGGGPSFRNNLFVVEIYDASFSKLLLASEPQSELSFTPSRRQWNAIRRVAGGNLHWLVRAEQLSDPVTGPYVSCPRMIALQ